MKIRFHTLRQIAALAVGLAVVGAIAASAQAARPDGMSPAEYRALMLRSQALNELYGGGAPEGMAPAEYRAVVIRGQAMNAMYQGAVPKGPAPETLRADRVRGQELNRLYGNPLTGMTPAEFRGYYVRGIALNRLYTPGGTTHVTPTSVEPGTVVHGDGFDWVDAGVGAGGMLGLVLLLAAGLTVGTHRLRPGSGHPAT
jgi:hypothetical protein